MKILIVVALTILAIVALVEAKVSLDELLLVKWKEFKAIQGKTYESADQEDRRSQIYLATRKSIAEHNYGYARGANTYCKAVNKFADIERKEFLSSYTGLKARQTGARSIPRSTFISKFDSLDLPKSVDWRTKGAVTPVKNQYGCGSSWAFSATGSLEGEHAIKTGKLVPLSAQQLVDFSQENDGCNGGMAHEAFIYIIENGGIESEKSYPYAAMDGECQFNASKVTVKMRALVDIDEYYEDLLTEAVATVGPVSVAIDATEALEHYSDGVFSDDECDPGNPNHLVLLVGCGTDKEQGDYWIVKNVWASIGEMLAISYSLVIRICAE